MADQHNSSGGKLNGGNDAVARHLVSLPTILLQRIDESTIKSIQSKNSAVEKPLKNASKLMKKPTSPVKPIVNNSTPKKIGSRPRGRPRKYLDDSPKLQKLLKNPVNKSKPVLKLNKPMTKRKIVSKVQTSAAKNILKKTMLQKKSKVVIPQAKKPKLIKKGPIKKSPPKNAKLIEKKTTSKNVKPVENQTTPKNVKPVENKTTPKNVKPVENKTTPKNAKPVENKTKLDVVIKPPAPSDSSEDDFLYDELIDELENTLRKVSKTSSEKTTNITLKPSSGNKPPTIVKGGIIKINNLPPDLKSIASPGQKLPRNEIKELVSNKRTKLQQTDCPVPPKKNSPWPISISATPKRSPSKNKKTTPAVTKTTSKNKKPSPVTASTLINKKSVISPQQTPPKTNGASKPDVNVPNNEYTVEEVKAISPGPRKHKFGPKLVSNVGPSHLYNDDDLSDEYTEIETLENLDEEGGTVSNEIPLNNIHNKTESDKNTINKLTPSTLDNVNGDEDPNIDLLRILTDESDDCTQSQSENATSTIQSSEPCNNKTQIRNENVDDSVVNLGTTPKEPVLVQQIEKEPKVRTIYDLINEVSLQRPSWNLHIIPETNAFCIAQVTKGRLGLPTLKKCIELDALTYNAKVYIHQYHIKRFDGIYDSEDGILALIDEIDTIKA